MASDATAIVGLAALMCCAVLGMLALLYVNKRLGTSNNGGSNNNTTSNTGGGSTTGTVQAGALLGTVFGGTIDIAVPRGSGTNSSTLGRHAYDRSFGGSPFPISSGGIIVSFDIQFAPGYEWGCRGKIGGVSVGTGDAGGGDFSDNGASARAMWDKDGGSYVYVYVPSGTASRQPAPVRPRGNNGGIVFQQNYRRAFKTGTWHRVDLGVKLNTPGQYDGRLLYAVDGRTSTLNDILWRKGNYSIGRFFLGVFHGGGCEATRNSSMQVKNIRVYKWQE